MSRTVPGGPRPEWPHDPEHGYGSGGAQGAPGNGYGYGGGHDAPGGQGGYGQWQYGQAQYGQPQYGQPQYGQPQPYDGQGYNGYGQGQQGYGDGGQPGGDQDWGYDGRRTGSRPAAGNGAPGGYQGGRGPGDTQRYEAPGQYGDAHQYDDTQRYDTRGQYGDTQRYDTRGQYGDTQRLSAPSRPADGRRYTDGRRHQETGGMPGLGGPGGPGGPRGPRGPGGPGGPGQGSRRRPGGRTPARRVRFRRIRRLYRRRTVRIATAIFAVFSVFVLFSAGQATFKNNGQSLAANLAEWARDHYLGPIVTFGEYLTYSPPPTGGKPTFSLAVPKGEQIANAKAKKKGFAPDIPATLKSLAGAPIPGEGQWRVVEKVHGQPAIFTTFLRDATYTSEVNGIASMDQRLVKFQLHPGSEDPGPGNWGPWGSDYIPAGARTGLIATFNSGFKLDAAQGGFYLNGQYHGSLVQGGASVVYYKNGTIKIGSWGQEVTMTPQVEAVRQNLKLLIDHGKIAPNLNQNIESAFGATLGGGYYVWRSGLGITKDGRIVYVYGPALDVQDLADLLHRAGAIEGMQLDINPYWMKYEYYTVQGNPADPQPTNLLPTQQQSAFTYYSPYTRDFTAVYAR